MIGTCSKEFNIRDKQVATTPLNRNKQVTFKETCGTSNKNTQTYVEQQKVQKTNVPVIPSTGVNSSTAANKFTKSKVVPLQQPEHVCPSEIVITERFSNTTQKPLTRYKRRNKKDKTISIDILTTAETQTIDAPVKYTTISANQQDPNRIWGSKIPNSLSLSLKNFVKKFIGIVRFGNDHFGAIMGYGYYVIVNSVISKVYYMEGLGHNLLSVGQFYDSDLEVAVKKHSCYVRDIDGVELLKGNHGSNLYTISVEDIMKSSPICLFSKASKNK
ncbi:hypothetical protein Tco_0592533 [Tanacetum coccineum]